MTLYPSPTLYPSSQLFPGMSRQASGSARGTLISAMSVEGPDGVDVPLMLGRYRKISKIEALAGFKARKVKRPRTGRHGSRDLTRFRDENQVVITGLVWGETADRAWDEWYEVSRAMAGSIDTDRLMKFTVGGERALQMTVRADDLTAPVEVGPNLLRYQATLTAPDPNAYSQDEQVAFGTPLTTGGGGIVAPITAPIKAAPLNGGLVAVFNEGSVPTPPLIVLRGFLLNPIVQLGDRRLVFQGSIAAGHALSIDAQSSPRRVLLDGSINRINLLTFEESRWFDLPTRDSKVQLLAEDWSDTHRIEVHYRHAYD